VSRLPGRPRVAVAMAIASCLALCGVALAATKVVGTSHTSAAVSYRSGPLGVVAQRLTITLDGTKLYDQPVTSRYCNQCAPNPLISHKKVLRVLDLAGDGQLEVVLSLFTGGAHCCVVEQVYTGTSRGTYVKDEHEFDAGAILTDIGNKGRYELVSADAGFAYEFSDYAHSGQPIQIWSVVNRRFRTVTASYPGLIRADAAKWLRAFHHSIPNGVGLIAAWAADEDRLGHSKLVSTTLDTYARQGKLRSGDPSYASGRPFVAQLQRFLRRNHYTH
jgi:hypothetical protein